MPITAYSIEFDKELTPENYLQHYFEKYHRDASPEFIKNDIECPCCGVRNGYVVKKTHRKQSHFAFKSEISNQASHLVSCCFFKNETEYGGLDYGFIKPLGEERSHITNLIHTLIATGLSNEIFKYSDIKEFRLWFLNIKSNEDYKIINNEHLAKILRHRFERPTTTLEYKIYSNISKRSDVSEFINIIKKEFDTNLDVFSKKKDFTEALRLCSALEGQYSFSRLPEFYKTSRNVNSLSRKILNHLLENTGDINFSILNQVDRSQKITSTLFNQRSKLFTAYSFLLLNINEMDFHRAFDMHSKISKIIDVKNIKDYPNLISINPLNKFYSWAIVEIISKASSLIKCINFDEIYEEELSIYTNKSSYFIEQDENKEDLPF